VVSGWPLFLALVKQRGKSGLFGLTIADFRFSKTAYLKFKTAVANGDRGKP